MWLPCDFIYMLGISLTPESAESTLTYHVATCHVMVCCWSLLEVAGPLIEIVRL